MGTSKLLLPLAGIPLLARVVDAVLGGGVDEVVVVVGPEADDLRASLAGRPVQWAVNPLRDGDMLSSVRCGIRAASAATAGLVVTPGDLAHLSAPVVSAVVGAFRAAAQGIVVPVYRGRRGHPLIFASRFREIVLTRFDGIGLRGLLEDHAAAVIEVPVGTDAILTDVDTRADYERAQQELRTRGGAAAQELRGPWSGSA
jgi:molybdenum cofactor cytidylyltransferase